LTITIVVPFVNLTGGIRVVLDYANWLHDEGHRVTVVYPAWPYRFHFTRHQQWSEFRRQLFTVPAIPWFDLRCRLRRVPFVADAFLPRADLAVATSWPTAHAVARLHPACGKKVHLVFHHESGTGPEDRIRQIYALPFHRIAFSLAIRQTIETRFRCEIHDVVPVGVDTSRFFQDGDRMEKTVLMLYHNDPRKGAQDGIEAMTRLRSRCPEVKVLMCGTVRPERLPSWISFLFHPTDHELRRLYSASTVFLYPSRYEGFGLPPLEAMASGCPVVTTAVGAVPEFATDGHNARIVSPGDVPGMADALQELLSQPRLRMELSREGLATIDRYRLPIVAPLFRDALMRA